MEKWHHQTLKRFRRGEKDPENSILREIKDVTPAEELFFLCVGGVF